MYKLESKHIFGMYAIGIIAALQITAWALGKNGAVWAFTSLALGAVIGSILKITLTKK